MSTLPYFNWKLFTQIYRRLKKIHISSLGGKMGTMRRCRVLGILFVWLLCWFGSGIDIQDETHAKDPFQMSEGISFSLIAQAAASTSPMDISDNPNFFTSAEKHSTSPAVKDLDGLIRLVLVKTFGGAKLVEVRDTPEKRLDGEVILTTMTYVVRRLLDGPAGDELHRALMAAGFARSPRIGAKPSHSRKAVVMSFHKTTSRAGYSLVFKLDLIQQKMEIQSYKLSRSDRM